MSVSVSEVRSQVSVLSTMSVTYNVSEWVKYVSECVKYNLSEGE